MVYFQGIFLSQTHKTRSGYYLNHDNMMSVSQKARKQLIAYFIAEQLPEKLNEKDQIEYQYEKFHRITLPTATWTVVGIFAPICLGLVTKKAFFRAPIAAPLQWLTISAFFGAIANSVIYRCCEASMMERSPALLNISDKYNFTIYDFAIAKKQSHVKRLLQVMDSNHETLHQE